MSFYDEAGVLPSAWGKLRNGTGRPEPVLTLSALEHQELLERRGGGVVVVLAGSQTEARQFATRLGLHEHDVIAPGWPSSLDGARVRCIYTLDSYYRRPGGWRRSVEEALKWCAHHQGQDPQRINVRS